MHTQNGLLQALFIGCIILLSTRATAFQLPSPPPQWPPGTGFATGTIDLGGLLVSQVSNFTKIWSAQEHGPNNVGATFYEPTAIPDGFFVLGHYGQPNNIPLFGWVLVAKDVTNGNLTAPPLAYILLYTSVNTGIKQDNAVYIWLPVPPNGYNAVGHVVTTTQDMPSLDKIRCVRADFTDVAENDDWVWGTHEVNIYLSRPKDRGTKSLGVSTGTFIAQNSPIQSVACLKNVKPTNNTSAMPNLNQIEKLIQTYSPWIYFHPNDEFLPSSVTWFFQNGALLYTKGQESNPAAVKPNGENLPQGGADDGAYWLDLPTNDPDDRVKKGFLPNSTCYMHVKPMFGATFTDIAVWVFYPFNGAARAKLDFVNVIKLGRIGEHVGDWEHVTLRISNFNGELKRMYFSEHGKGAWLSASQLEFQNGNKPVVYSSFHGHAAYPKPGLVLHGGGNIGIRDDTEKGDVFMDTGASFSVVSAEYLGAAVVEPPWLNFAREWGPKITYGFEKELVKVERVLPWKLKDGLEKIIKKIPSEVLDEKGPTGPKWKDNWNGDEFY